MNSIFHVEFVQLNEDNMWDMHLTFNHWKTRYLDFITDGSDGVQFSIRSSLEQEEEYHRLHFLFNVMPHSKNQMKWLKKAF